MTEPLAQKSPNVKLPRAYSKCERCRTKHLKCLPCDRDWSEGQKCVNCIKANAPCSENTVFSKPGVNNLEARDISSPPTVLPVTTSTQPAGPSFKASAADLQCSLPYSSGSTSILQSETGSFAYDAHGNRGKQVESTNDFDACLDQLRQISDLGELLDYLWDRRNAVKELEAAFAMIGLDLQIRAIDFHNFAISNLAVPALRTIDHLRLTLSDTEQELLARRTLDALQPILAYHHCKRSGPAQQSCNWAEVDALIEQLVAQYERRGHHAEARIIATIARRREQYLTGCDLKMLKALSGRLKSTFATACRNIPNDYREDIIPKGDLVVDAGSLAVLGGRHDYSIEPSLCGLMSKPDILGRNELHLGAERCDLPYVRWVIAWRKKTGQTYSLESRDKFGLTVLMISIYRGCLEIFQLLVKEGASIHARDPQGRNILTLASICGSLPIIEEIFGLDVPMLDSIRLCSPIHNAAAAGSSVHVIRLLMHHGADPRQPYVEYGNLPASHIAASSGHDIIAAVLEEFERQLDRRNGGTKPTADQSQMLRTLETASLIGSSMSGSACSSSSSRPAKSPKLGGTRIRKRARHDSSKSNIGNHNITTNRRPPILPSQHASPEALNESPGSMPGFPQSEVDIFNFNPPDFVDPQDLGLRNEPFSFGTDPWSTLPQYPRS